MVISKRERLIAILAGGTLAILGVDRLVVSPYNEERDRVVNAQADVKAKLSEAGNLFAREHKLLPIWTSLQKGGLKTDITQADIQAQTAMNEYVQWSGVEKTALKLVQLPSEEKFALQGYELTGSGTMRQISRLVWALETATIPLRLSQVQITPRREGTDDLSVHLVIATLSKTADTDRLPAPGSHGTGAQ